MFGDPLHRARAAFQGSTIGPSMVNFSRSFTPCKIDVAIHDGAGQGVIARRSINLNTRPIDRDAYRVEALAIRILTPRTDSMPSNLAMIAVILAALAAFACCSSPEPSPLDCQHDRYRFEGGELVYCRACDN
jgi:hypothetical protein